ncbi:MAG: MBL fold metallo-hydrolase [Actinomyces sp.]|nr:MAG: MBL fold metallo-hydrolase [Actinomyces sp.]
MIFEQHYLDCLSQASYLIGDETTRKAVVVDPRRDIEAYLESARQRDLEIVMIIETHFHADFLSGHLELAERTGATIAYGPGARTEFPSRNLADGECIELGEVTLRALHTPGHTPESLCVLVYETRADLPEGEGWGRPHAVLTGDTLFIGDVGRPDLLSSVGLTAEELAGQLHDSLQRLLTLPDEVRVFPGHGAGSACGKNLSTETTSTIGEQRRTNYALQPMSREEFIGVVTEGQPVPPAYFPFDAVRNRQLHDLLDERLAPPALTLDEVIRHQRAGAVVVDTRSPDEFARGHLVGALNVGLEGRFAEYAGAMIQPGAPIVLVGAPGTEADARNRLARVGFDNVIGHLPALDTILADHPDEVVTSRRVDVAELDRARAEVTDLQLVDVRQPGETAGGVIEGAITIPLTRLNAELARLDAARPTIVYCAGGYRSSIAASRMAAAGFADVSDLVGGYNAWVDAHAPAAV